jgi:hypothetical protein
MPRGEWNMVCQHLEELHELWLLGVVSGAGANDLPGHLARGCPNCLARMREASEIVYILSLRAKPLRPSPRIKAELFAKIPSPREPRG